MSGSVDSQDSDIGNSTHPTPSDTLTKKNSSRESPAKNVASKYGNSFESSSTSKSKQVSDIELSSTFEETQRLPSKCLSAWEKWLCNKEEEKRKYIEQSKVKRREKEIEEKKKEERKLERKLLADAAHNKWLKQVEDDHKRQVKLKREKAEQEKVMKENREKAIKETASQKYNDWIARKDKLKEESNREEKLEARAKLEKSEEKKQLNEEAFNKWLKEVSKRPKSQISTGYGYAGGVLISYYDRTSSPRPSYCNPKPWIRSTEDNNDE